MARRDLLNSHKSAPSSRARLSTSVDVLSRKTARRRLSRKPWHSNVRTGASNRSIGIFKARNRVARRPSITNYGQRGIGKTGDHSDHMRMESRSCRQIYLLPPMTIHIPNLDGRRYVSGAAKNIDQRLHHQSLPLRSISGALPCFLERHTCMSKAAVRPASKTSS